MRTIIIGDIHGCYQALVSLLQVLQADPASDRLVFLGDLFDRGPESFEVWQTVMGLEREFGENFVLLRGNHEDYLLQQKLTLRQRRIWEKVGRGATVASFKAHGADMKDAAPWLADRCRLYWKGDGIQCVHAGLLIDPPEINDTYTLLHDHDIVLNNTYSGPLTVVGHIALDKPVWFAGDRETLQALEYGVSRQLPERGIICIDTGCGKGGCLTAMTVEDGRFELVSVPEE